MEAAFDSVMEDGSAYDFHEAAAAMLRVIAVRLDINQPQSPFLWLCDQANKAKLAKQRPD
jgi:hypothetical protein